MTKMIFKKINSIIGLFLIISLSSLIGAIMIKEVVSFFGPSSPPAGGNGISADTGVIGNPSAGVAGANNLFTGQKKIYDLVNSVCSGGGGGSSSVSCSSTKKLITNRAPVSGDHCPAGYSECSDFSGVVVTSNGVGCKNTNYYNISMGSDYCVQDNSWYPGTVNNLGYRQQCDPSINSWIDYLCCQNTGW